MRGSRLDLHDPACLDTRENLEGHTHLWVEGQGGIANQYDDTVCSGETLEVTLTA
jgi:hypothetical protein